MRKIRAVLVGALVALVVVGCGGDDDGGSDSSGLDRDSTLDELTAADAADFCEWAEGLLDPTLFVEFTCTLTAIAASQQNEELVCEDIAAECIDTTEIPDDEVNCAVAELDLPPCASEVTVGDFEDCLAATADVLIAIVDGVSCDTSPEDLPDGLDDLEIPEACAAIQEVCPDLFESDDE
jgi:hypothetical protein